MALALLSTALRHARDWGECALNLAFPWPETDAAEPEPIRPPYCEQCGDPVPAGEALSGSFVCTPCAGHDWYFLWARAGYRTSGQVHEAIVGYKYRDESHHHDRLVAWLTETFDRHARGGDWHALVPVPLYHRRRRERGFNQAVELANGLGFKRKIAVLNCLYRYRETPSQTGLERPIRWKNMQNAFRLKPGFDVTGKNLLLIDDVFTTGATTNACARTLAQAGAGRLAVLTIARS
jgi:ComF family protein